ncbi:ABC-2 transporter permease [Oceanirhabdus sp. W0125-5]|uniref:ABC-2 transporter permease n=1 Tax=Oceanirhabdus sp. W0125-5 TaxID=2999116 RepID=UPI0022F2DC77|nr:ABC-2 transporter permease [Oceanirhabdus sp. W0125-5]WBW95737.1 ABC-2 transporter permease [Oceanirhabdus sp. W0125-5]
MLNLLYKDFKLQKMGIKGLLLCCVIFFVLDQSNIDNYIYGIVTPIIIYSYAIVGISYDNYFRVEQILVSLPISKKEIVLSKYINIIIAAVFGIIIAIALIFIATFKLNIAFSEFLDLERLLVSIVGSVFVVLWLVPAYLKYGLIKGKVVTVVAMIILFVANMIFDAFNNIKHNIFESNYAIVMLIALFLISVVLSYSISSKLYERREF